MSLETKDVLVAAAKILAAGVASSVPGEMGVTIEEHRKLTHHSLKVHPLLTAYINWEMRTYAPEPTIWAAVHRVHHSVPDANLAPFWRIYKAFEHPSKVPNGVDEPKRLTKLDRFVDYFSFNEVMGIGEGADAILKDRLGGHYEDISRSKDELKVLLDPKRGLYLYPDSLKREGEYTMDEMADILLRDPHSPVLVPSANGVRGIFLHNVDYYRVASHLFRDMPDLKPEDLQTGEKVNHQEVRVRGFVEGALLNSALVMKYRDRYTPQDVLIALAAGTAIRTVALGLHISGGNITNSLGHAGEITNKEDLLKAAFSDRFDLKPNRRNGTLSTNTIKVGPLGDLAGRGTLDEVGGQDEHHFDPGKIAYTSKEGPEAWDEAGWGMLLTILAESDYFPLLSRGDGFPGLKPGEPRPDDPTIEVQFIQKKRVEQMEQEKVLQPV